MVRAPEHRSEPIAKRTYSGTILTMPGAIEVVRCQLSRLIS